MSEAAARTGGPAEGMRMVTCQPSAQACQSAGDHARSDEGRAGVRGLAAHGRRQVGGLVPDGADQCVHRFAAATAGDGAEDPFSA
jgi:hypothetical protein